MSLGVSLFSNCASGSGVGRRGRVGMSVLREKCGGARAAACAGPLEHPLVALSGAQPVAAREENETGRRAIPQRPPTHPHTCQPRRPCTHGQPSPRRLRSASTQCSSFDTAGPTSAHTLLRASRSTPDVQYTLPYSPHALPALTKVTFVELTSIRFPTPRPRPGRLETPAIGNTHPPAVLLARLGAVVGLPASPFEVICPLPPRQSALCSNQARGTAQHKFHRHGSCEDLPPGYPRSLP